MLDRQQLGADPCWRQLARAHRSPSLGIVAALPLLRAAGRLLVISDENLLGPMPGSAPGVPYPGHPRLLRTLRGLDALADVSLRVVLRRQDRWLESLYAFRVGRGMTLGFDDFLAGFRGIPLSWLPLVRSLQRARPGSVRVGLLEGLFATGTEAAVARFLELPTLRPWNRPLGRHHASLSAPLLEIARYFHRSAPLTETGGLATLRRALAALATGDDAARPPAALLRERLEAAGLSAQARVADEALSFARRERPGRLTATERRALLTSVASDNATVLRSAMVEEAAELWADR